MRFISTPALHTKRLKRGWILIAIGLALSGVGGWAVVSELRAGSSDLISNWLTWGPFVIAAALLVFGIVGAVTGARGAARADGDDSIDLIVTDDGFITRGARQVPWSNIGFIEVIRYINNSMVPLLWDYSVLNRVVRIHLRDRSQIDPGDPGVRGSAPRHFLEIDLRRYPRSTHQDSLDELVDLITQSPIPYRTAFKHKQF